MQEQRLEDEKTNSCRETALIVAHYEEIRKPRNAPVKK